MGGAGNLPDSLGHLPSETKADVPTRNLSASRRIACSDKNFAKSCGQISSGTHCVNTKPVF